MDPESCFDLIYSRNSHLIFFLAGLLVFFAMAVVLTGCAQKASPPPANGGSDQASVLIPGLSPAQSKTVQELGYPDQFSISFDPYGSLRMETWIYFSENRSIDFTDGRLSSQQATEDQADKYPPTTLRPQDFNRLMTPEEAAEILGQPVVTQDVEDSLMGGKSTVVVFNNAILLYRNGQLISVDTQVKPPSLPAPQ